MPRNNAFSRLLIAALSLAVTTAKFDLPPLPYSYSALTPLISSKTLKIHHDKHHAKYVNTMNSLIEGTALESKSLEDIIKTSAANGDTGLFNNAAQSWNHEFYWKCMKRNGGGNAIECQTLSEMIESSFGSMEEFKNEFTKAGNTAFGSGWAWLCYNSKTNTLVVQKTIGAGNPMVQKGMIPILTMDVWEHAYYLDYQNVRASYVDAFLDKLVNWEFVAENLKEAIATADANKLFFGLYRR